MTATGLDVFDQTIVVTNTWRRALTEALGPDRQVACGVCWVVRTLRDRLPLGRSVGAQPPLLLRWRPSEQPKAWRSLDEFPAIVSADLRGLRPVGCKDAARAVFQGRNRYVDPGQVAHVREALPQEVRDLRPAARKSGIDPAA
jgi:uncharacterized protein (DUF2267 family)